MQIGRFLWGDNWWIEGDKAYICSTVVAAVFCVDMTTLQCEFYARIPYKVFRKYRLNSYCVKYKDKIFCFPYEDRDICCYRIKERTWDKVKIGFANRLMICNDNCETDSSVWLMEHTKRKLFQVNLDKEIVEREYVISSDKNAFSGFYVKVENNLYCTAGKQIHCINIKDGSIITYELPKIRIELYTISYDGCDFWLSGYGEAVYVWNPQKGIIKEIKITDFVEKIDVICKNSSIIMDNMPLFEQSVFTGKHVWYIPLQCNAPLIYIDKDSYKAGVLNIEGEQETEESLIKRGLAFKYDFEYIRQDRYIGLYSCKRQIVFEIDTIKMCVDKRKYIFTDKTVQSIAYEIYNDRRLLDERYKTDREIFSILLNSGVRKKKGNYLNVGTKIHEYLLI